jgi:CRP-like cAMP-binding protein
MGTSPPNPEELLARSELFHGLNQSALHAFLQIAASRTYSAREFLARQGERATQLSLVISGLGKFCDTTSEGDQLILGWLREGEVCGLGALLGYSTTYMLSAQAMKDCQVLQWSSPTLRDMVSYYPGLITNALKIGMASTGIALERLRLMATESVERRLAVLVTESAEQIGRRTSLGFELSLGDQELAEVAGTSLFSVSRVLQHWERRGYLTKSRGRILIHNGSNLSQLVKASRTLDTQPGAS